MRGAELDQTEQSDRDGHPDAPDSSDDRSREDGLATWSRTHGHETGRLAVEAEREPERGVHEEVDPQHLRRGERLPGADVEEGRAKKGQDECDEEHEHEADVLREVVVDLAALLNGVDDGCEVVVGEDHPAGGLRDVGATAHGDSDVSSLDRRRVVDAIAGHGDDVSLLLERVGE